MQAKRWNALMHFSLHVGLLLLLLGFASAVGFAFRALRLPETNTAIVYLLAVLLTARMVPGYLFGFLSSIVSAFAFNYLFTVPYFTFTANAPSYIITFIIMTITSLVTSALTSHTKLSERRAQESEAEIKAVYALTNRLTDAANLQDIAAIAADTISRAICEKSACLCFDAQGMPEKSFVQQVSPCKQVRRALRSPDALLHRIEGLRTGFDAGDEFYDWPIYGREMTLGLIRLPAEPAQTLSKAQTRLLRSMIESIALAMDRFRSAEQRIRLREETTQERYRSSLLRAISHDLRTPLAGILGTAEVLLSKTPAGDERRPLLAGIHKDARWLHALVENILSLTRLQDSKLALRKQIEAVEEILGSAAEQISRRHPQYDIAVHAPDTLFLVPMDAKLILQVLINLLENAVKHTAPPGEISVSAAQDLDRKLAVFTVRDNGCGIHPDDLPHIFEMFYTSQLQHADSRPGIGLGLAICDAIIKAHGGSIAAQNRVSAPGAEFTFTLPMEAEPNESS